MSILSEALLPIESAGRLVPSRQVKKFHHQIELFSFCLMPNHFHLAIYQTDERVMAEFVRSILLRYVMYFNKKNNRVGPLFQSHYKAVYTRSDEQLVHLSRYIHRNPLAFGYGAASLGQYPFSSYAHYLGLKEFPFLLHSRTFEIFCEMFGLLNHTRQAQQSAYKDFVEKDLEDDLQGPTL